MTNWMRDAALGLYLLHPMVISIALRAGIVEPGVLAIVAIIGSVALLLLWSGAIVRLVPESWRLASRRDAART